MIVLKIIGLLIGIMILILIISVFVFGVQCFAWFHWRLCKYCGHTLEYKGLKEDNEDGHYSFHCPHCGAWLDIPREEFFREMDKGFDPNEQSIY